MDTINFWLWIEDWWTVHLIHYWHSSLSFHLIKSLLFLIALDLFLQDKGLRFRQLSLMFFNLLILDFLDLDSVSTLPLTKRFFFVKRPQKQALIISNVEWFQHLLTNLLNVGGETNAVARYYFLCWWSQGRFENWPRTMVSYFTWLIFSCILFAYFLVLLAHFWNKIDFNRTLLCQLIVVV